MNTASVQLWGGPQDGLRAEVQVGEFTGPPSFVDVPESSVVPRILTARTESGDELDGVSTIRYRLLTGTPHRGEYVYGLERKTRA